jgi:hypothetical protein
MIKNWDAVTQSSLRDSPPCAPCLPGAEARAILIRPSGAGSAGLYFCPIAPREILTRTLMDRARFVTLSFPALQRWVNFVTPSGLQKVGGVLTHNSQVSLRPGFFQRCGVALSK